MNHTRPRLRLSAGASVLAVGLVGLAGVGVAAAQDSQPAPAASASAAPTAGASAAPTAGAGAKKDHRAWMRRPGLHSESVHSGKDGAYVTVLTQRGAVVSVDSSGMTVRSGDGFTHTYALTGDTHYRRAGDKGGLADVKNGVQVGVVAVRQGDRDVARVVAIKP